MPMRCFLGLVLIGVTFAEASLHAQGASNAATTAYTIATAAGSDWVGDGGAATAGILLQAQGIATDFNGNLYVSDAVDHRVRKISPQGVIATIAGTGEPGFSGDGGPASAAQLNSPYGLAYSRGNLYIADLGNARVRRIGPDGAITTIVGGGSIPAGGMNDGSAATLLALMAPRNIAIDGPGILYISDFGGQRVYRMGTDGSLTTVAGTGVRGYSGDFGAAITAQVNYPAALALDGQGALYIADSQNHLIRKVANGMISSYARAVTPTGLTLDGSGTLYVADSAAGQILEIAANGAATAIGISASDLSWGADGNLYAATNTTVERISASASGYQTAIVAGGGNLAYGDLGPAASARFNHPSGVDADGLGNFYISDRDNDRIRKVAADGTVTTVAGMGAPGDSGDAGLATAALLNAPSAVSVDVNGNVYISDTGNHRVRRVTPAGVIQAVAGTGTAGGTGDQGPAFLAELHSPGGVVADPAGNVYIADTGNGKIRVVSGATVLISTLLDGLQGPRLGARWRGESLFHGRRRKKGAPFRTFYRRVDGHRTRDLEYSARHRDGFKRRGGRGGYGAAANHARRRDRKRNDHCRKWHGRIRRRRRPGDRGRTRVPLGRGDGTVRCPIHCRSKQ